MATIIGTATILWRIIFINNGEVLKNIVYKSENIIIQRTQEGNRNLIILGSGYSISIDEQNAVISHDPLMVLPNIQFQEETVLSIFYPFESKGLESAGKQLSTFINSIAKKYDSITFIGHSKCGVCFANAVKWVEHNNINIVTISTPFQGTYIADRDVTLEKLSWIEGKIYTIFFSNHLVDQDIIPNSKFIQSVDYSGLIDCTHINIITECPQQSRNLLDIILTYLDEKLGIKGDGIVPKASQQCLLYSNTIEIEIEATHATSLKSGVKIAKEIMQS